jgi:pyruvate, orthophosphate dikinase
VTGQHGVVPLAEAAGLDRSAIGGKAASLVELVGLGLRVPPAFVVTSDVCRSFLRDGKLAPGVTLAVREALSRLEAATGRSLGAATDPLLVSVRSGAGDSMPGMMDTVLDVGFGPGTRAALAARGGEDFARSCHRRFLTGYAGVVLQRSLPSTTDPAELAAVLAGEVPDDPFEQLLAAVGAVFRSWNNPRARAYRDHYGMDHDVGTAVVVQAMVFGNRGTGGGSGVAFSRDPNTGEPGLYGDFLPGAQGADVVAGSHDPLPVAALGDVSSEALAELDAAVAAIEAATGDMVDVEFTVQDGTLYVLQHRAGPRAAAAAVRIAVDLVDAGAITVQDALARVTPAQLSHAARPCVAPDAPALLATGLGASPGVAVGEVCFSPDHVTDHAGPVVLVRPETAPDDVHGMTGSAGLLTARGGLVSHAALLARELDLPAVVGVAGLRFDPSGVAHVGSLVLREGDRITIDGTSGRVHAGDVPVVAPAPARHLDRLRSWMA